MKKPKTNVPHAPDPDVDHPVVKAYGIKRGDDGWQPVRYHLCGERVLLVEVFGAGDWKSITLDKIAAEMGADE
jgi:hypothetical protein